MLFPGSELSSQELNTQEDIEVLLNQELDWLLQGLYDALKACCLAVCNAEHLLVSHHVTPNLVVGEDNGPNFMPEINLGGHGGGRGPIQAAVVVIQAECQIGSRLETQMPFHATSRIAATILSVCHLTTLSAAFFTTVEVFSDPQGSIAMMGFRSRLAISISMLIHLL